MSNSHRIHSAAAACLLVVLTACGSATVTTTAGDDTTDDALAETNDRSEEAVGSDSPPQPIAPPTDPPPTRAPTETTILGATDPDANPACFPDPDLALEPLTGDDRRFENIEDFLTGYRLEDFQEGDAPVNADTNWGGIWGDFEGGIVVAVLDCSLIDVNEIARLAGPVGVLRIIEVPYTFDETERFKRDVVEAARSLDIDEWGVQVESTLSGREIILRLPAAMTLPQDFAPTVPSDAYTVVNLSEPADTTG